MNWTKIWNDIVNFFKTNVWNIVIFFAVLLFGIIIVKLLINISRRILNKTKMEKIAVGFIVGILKLALYLILILILLSIMGVEITGVLTAFSAILLSVGLALQENIANVANGIIIVSSKMFKKGDYIQVDGIEGSITQINFLYTTIMTTDNKRITIPNTKIVNNAVIDFDSNLTRRVNFTFSVAYESDIEKVKSLIIDCMKSNGKVLLSPEPFCRLSAMKDSSLEFTARCWCDKEDYWTVYYDTMETVFNEFKRNNISVPFNQMEIRERTDSPVLPIIGKGLPERVEKVREVSNKIDLENSSFSEIFASKRNIKHKKFKKSKKKDEIVQIKEDDVELNLGNNDIEDRATQIGLNESIQQIETFTQDEKKKKNKKKD